MEGFNRERDSMKKGRREGIQGRTEQEERTLRCTHVQMCAQACKQKRQEGVTDLANLKRNQGREGNGGGKERRMGRGKGERKGRKEGRKKERRKDGTTEGRTKRRKKRRNDKNMPVSASAALQPLPCLGARTPHPKLDSPTYPAASPHSATPRVSFPLSLPTNSFPRPNPTSKTFHPSSPVPLFLSPIPTLRSFAPTLFTTGSEECVVCLCVWRFDRLTSGKKTKKKGTWLSFISGPSDVNHVHFAGNFSYR